MTTINERIRELRKAKGLTLEQFGARIGLRKSGVSKIERGENAPTEQTLLFICREFSVSEEWLRTGEGSMQLPGSRKDSIRSMLDTLEDGSFKERLVSALADLSVDDWEKVHAFALKLLEEEKAEPELLAAHLRDGHNIAEPEAQEDIKMIKALERQRPDNDKI